ncbi:MAG: PepSY domain-containing protein [Alphaproteobacteria bacterium]|nr:PepSY domain-containing protein [Alphaproteobacteria bacterium]
MFSAVFAAATVTLAVSALADGGDGDGDEIPGHSEANEQEFALKSVVDGSALPLVDVLTEVQKTVQGQLLEARLKRRQGVLVYVLTVLSTSGTYSLVLVDAKTKKILEIKEK